MDEIVIYKINQIINSKLTCYIRKHLNMQHNNIPLTYKVHKPQKSLILIGIILSTLSFTRCADLPIPANRLENPIINPADELNILETEALTLMNSINNVPKEQIWSIVVNFKNKLLEIIEKEIGLLFTGYFKIIEKWLEKNRILKIKFSKASINRDTASTEILKSIGKSPERPSLHPLYEEAEDKFNEARTRYYERGSYDSRTTEVFKNWKETIFVKIMRCVDNLNNGRWALDDLFYYIGELRYMIGCLKSKIDSIMSDFPPKIRSKDEISIIAKEYEDTLKKYIWIGTGKSDVEIEIINRRNELIDKFKIYVNAEYEMRNHDDIRQLQLKLREIFTDIHSEIEIILKNGIDVFND